MKCTWIIWVEVTDEMIPGKLFETFFDGMNGEAQGREFQSLGSLLKKKWWDILDSDLECYNFRADDDHVLPLQNVMCSRILNE